jgi:hypothetical protein
MKMKNKVLYAAVLATLGAGSAQAVNLGTDGHGEVLFFPYYTVQGDEKTLLTVVNTTDVAKAVKIRFREAENSREVLDFNIYLSPQDVWVGVITDNAAGDGAAVQSPDKTCTVPLAISQGQKIDFRKLAYAGGAANAPTPNPDSGTQDLSRTREGYVEIIEMGEPILNLAVGTKSTWDQNADGIADYMHAGGVPNNCAGLDANFKPGGVWAGAPGTDVNPPTGGIFGQLAIINVPTGTEIAENATALEDVFAVQQHYSTGTELPTIQDADTTSNILYNGALVTDVWGNGEDAVSAVLMASAISNTYTINPAVEAESAWVVTFPTKWAYTAPTDLDNDGQYEGAAEGDYAIEPFVNTFVNGKACELISVTAYDREETGQEGGDNDFSPSPGVPGVNLCYEVNVIQFGANSNVLSSANTTLRYTNLPGVAGWVKVGFVAGTDTNNNGILDHTMVGNSTYVGLPVIGFSVSMLGNSGVGVGASYAASNEHVYERDIQ